jgi:hypothetical protein
VKRNALFPAHQNWSVTRSLVKWNAQFGNSRKTGFAVGQQYFSPIARARRASYVLASRMRKGAVAWEKPTCEIACQSRHINEITGRGDVAYDSLRAAFASPEAEYSTRYKKIIASCVRRNIAYDTTAFIGDKLGTSRAETQRRRSLRAVSQGALQPQQRCVKSARFQRVNCRIDGGSIPPAPASAPTTVENTAKSAWLGS